MIKVITEETHDTYTKKILVFGIKVFQLENTQKLEG